MADKISGYRELSSAELQGINDLKALEQSTLKALDEIIELREVPMRPAQQRWRAIFRTHIEQGFMAAVRVIAKPNGE